MKHVEMNGKQMLTAYLFSKLQESVESQICGFLTDIKSTNARHHKHVAFYQR